MNDIVSVGTCNVIRVKTYSLQINNLTRSHYNIILKLVLGWHFRNAAPMTQSLSYTESISWRICNVIQSYRYHDKSALVSINILGRCPCSLIRCYSDALFLHLLNNFWECCKKHQASLVYIWRVSSQKRVNCYWEKEFKV